MRDFPNISWKLSEVGDKIGTWQKVEIAVLMDIRHELQRLNSLLSCPNVRAMPRQLERIARNTAKPKKRVSRRKK